MAGGGEAAWLNNVDRHHAVAGIFGVGGGQCGHCPPPPSAFRQCRHRSLGPGAHAAAHAAHGAGLCGDHFHHAQCAGRDRGECGAAAGGCGCYRRGPRLWLTDIGARCHHRGLPAVRGCGGGRRCGDAGRAERHGGAIVHPLHPAAGGQWRCPYHPLLGGDDGDKPDARLWLCRDRPRGGLRGGYGPGGGGAERGWQRDAR